MSVYTKLACFAGGALFGSFGIKLLSSKDAKKAYVHVTAAGLRMKDSVMGTVTTVQENAADILASAKELNEDRAAKEAEEAAAANLESEEAGLTQREPPAAPSFREGGTYERNHIARKPGAHPVPAAAKTNDTRSGGSAGGMDSGKIMVPTGHRP